MTETHDHSSLPSTILNFLSRLREEPERDDGQSLASPGSWPPALTRCPSSPSWLSAGKQFRVYTKNCRSPRHLTSLALGQVAKCPFTATSITKLNSSVSALDVEGWKLGRRARDREDVPIDFRYLDPLLRVAGDPEVGLGEFLTPKTGQTGQKFFWNSLTGQTQTQRPSGN